MQASVFVFRVVGLPDFDDLGWAVMSPRDRSCVVGGGTVAIARARLLPDLWPRIEWELAHSLCTRLLPSSSAIHQAVAAACGDRTVGVLYAACMPAAAGSPDGALADLLDHLRLPPARPAMDQKPL